MDLMGNLDDDEMEGVGRRKITLGIIFVHKIKDNPMEVFRVHVLRKEVGILFFYFLFCYP